MRKTIVTITAALALCFSTANAQRVEIRRTSGPSGYLGIRYDETVQRGETNSDHIIVREISKDSPAEKAGLKVGDEILRINGLAAGNGKFSALARTLVSGDTVQLRIMRDGKSRDVTVIAAQRPNEYAYYNHEIVIAPDSVRRMMLRFLDSARVHLDSLRLPSIHIVPGDSMIDLRIMPRMGDSLFFRRDSAGARIFRANPGQFERMLPREFEEIGPNMVFRSIELGARSIGGAELTELDPAMVDYFKTDHGVLVLRVAPETPAERAGLEPGDVIVKAKDRVVRRVDDLRSIVASNTDTVKLDILRKGVKKTLEIKTRR